MLKFSKHTISRRTFLRRATTAAPFVLLPAPLKAFASSTQLVHRTVFAMGTTVSIQAYHSDRTLAMNAISRAFNELRRIDSLLSLYNPSSSISAINAAAGKSEVEVEEFVAEVVNRSLHYSMLTNGVFDCTVEPLMKLWGFRENKCSSLPSDKDIYATMDAVGYKNISVRENSIGLLHRNSSIDLGGIAVGYTLDRMAAILRQEGIESAFINHSGDIFAIGSPPEKNGWEISIPNPFNKNEIVETITLCNKAISTSGSYEKFVECDGKRYGHIIDASTGTPARKYASISVIADTSLEADIFSTAWFCSERETIKNHNNDKRVLVVDALGNQQWL